MTFVSEWLRELWLRIAERPNPSSRSQSPGGTKRPTFLIDDIPEARGFCWYANANPPYLRPTPVLIC